VLSSTGTKMPQPGAATSGAGNPICAKP
jgi:hypothetical protein